MLSSAPHKKSETAIKTLWLCKRRLSVFEFCGTHSMEVIQKVKKGKHYYYYNGNSQFET